MTTSARAVGSFPSPFEISTPPGCEGWEELYPHYALFAEERTRGRREPALVLELDALPGADAGVRHRRRSTGPYYALANWQNRAFAVPPAMGIDYRVVNSYVYISVNAVTDPAKIAERAEFFQKRAGHYFQNWDELYAKWRRRWRRCSRSSTALEVPDLPEYEPDEVVFGDEDTSFYKLLDALSRAACSLLPS